MKKNKGKKQSMWKKAVSVDTERQKKQASKMGYFVLPKNVRLFKETPGSKVKMDFLPYIVTDPNHPDKNAEYGIAEVGQQWYKRPFKIHRGIGVSNEYVVCPTSVGKKCPICEFRAKRQKEGAPKEELQALNAQSRNLYIIIPKGVKDFEEVPHVWEMSQFLFQDKLNEEIEEDEDNACFPDLEEGKTLRIRFTEEVFAKNKYAGIGRIDFQERDEAYPESILKEVPNLDEVLQILSYKELEAKFYEVEPGDEDEDEDDEGKHKSSSKSKKHQVKSLDDDEEDDTVDDDDDDEKPTPKKRGRSSKPVVEQDDTVDDDDDEEPVHKKRVPAKKVVEEEEEEEEEEDDEEDSEDEDDSDEDEDLEDEDEEEIPKGMVKIKCIACGGSGKSSKGGVCSPCKGKGYKLVPAKKAPVVEDDDDDDDAPVAKKGKDKGKDKKVKEGAKKCPYRHEFGEDNDAFDECSGCKLWDDCYEASE